MPGTEIWPVRSARWCIRKGAYFDFSTNFHNLTKPSQSPSTLLALSTLSHEGSLDGSPEGPTSNPRLPPLSFEPAPPQTQPLIRFLGRHHARVSARPHDVTSLKN